MKMTRKSKTLGLLAVGICLLAVLWVGPVAQACCTPCNPWCKISLPPEAYCCTGIPEPGNACGLTICAKYLEMTGQSDDAALFQAPNLTLANTGSCGEQPLTFEAPAEGTDEVTTTESALADDAES